MSCTQLRRVRQCEHLLVDLGVVATSDGSARSDIVLGLHVTSCKFVFVLHHHHRHSKMEANKDSQYRRAYSALTSDDSKTLHYIRGSLALTLPLSFLDETTALS